MDFPAKLWYVYVIMIKINGLIFRIVMLNFSKVSRGVKQGSRRKPATKFCDMFKRIRNKMKEVLIKFIDNYIFIIRRVQSIQSVFTWYIVWCGCRGVRAHGGLGRLAVIQKKMPFPPSKTTILINYSPKFRLLFAMLIWIKFLINQRHYNVRALLDLYGSWHWQVLTLFKLLLVYYPEL